MILFSKPLISLRGCAFVVLKPLKTELLASRPKSLVILVIFVILPGVILRKTKWLTSRNNTLSSSSRLINPQITHSLLDNAIRTGFLGIGPFGVSCILYVKLAQDLSWLG